jgi:hypothetical protein
MAAYKTAKATRRPRATEDVLAIAATGMPQKYRILAL